MVVAWQARQLSSIFFINSRKPNLFTEELFGFGKALMTFMGNVDSTLTKGMGENETMSAKNEIMVIRNTQFVTNIVESMKVLGVDKGTGCL